MTKQRQFLSGRQGLLSVDLHCAIRLSASSGLVPGTDSYSTLLHSPSVQRAKAFGTGNLLESVENKWNHPRLQCFAIALGEKHSGANHRIARAFSDLETRHPIK